MSDEASVTVEQVSEEPKAAENKSQESDKFSEQFQRLSKQEKYVSDQRKQMEEARKAFEADKQLAEEMKQLKALKSADPVKALEKLGLTIDEINKAIQINNDSADPIAKKVRHLEEQLLNDQKAREKAEKEAKEARIQSAKIALEKEIDEVIEKEEYDLISTLNMKSEVIEYMEEMYKLSGEVIPVSEACKEITNHIVELHRKASNSKWIKEPKEPKESEKIPAVQKTTVSNKMTQSVIGADKPMSESERIQAAVNLVKTWRK